MLVALAALAAGCVDFNPKEAAGVRLSRSLSQLAEPGAPAERAWHTATLLADGSVLLAGGAQAVNDTLVPVASAERYVSASIGFEQLPDLSVARYHHTATRLLDGRVLLAGGFDASGAALASAELYSPDTGAFAETPGALQSPRGEHTATLLADGRVLLIGGFAASDRKRVSAGAELFDPAGGSFTKVAGGPTGAGRNVAVTLADGSVQVFWFDAQTQEVFDPTKNRFSLPSPPVAVRNDIGKVAAATRLGDGSLALFGTTGLARTCVDGLADCGGGVCVDLASDQGNCGACGVTCEMGKMCVDGACGCWRGSADCGSGCVDTNFDANNCGGCGNKCPADRPSCMAGVCSCPSGSADCGDGSCVDLSTDPDHCGACNNACAADEYCTCSDYYCSAPSHCATCSAPLERCGTSCVDRTSDAANCGGCGITCPSDHPLCSGGTCRLGCQPGWADCGSGCVDLTSASHCGACDNACGSGRYCDQGDNGVSCKTCVAPKTMCGASCVDLTSDAANCGACGQSCSPGACISGQCVCSGAICDGTCVDSQVDPLNCGGCKISCGTGRCQSGQCVPACATGETVCDSGCTLLESDTQNCGACGNTCPDGYTCNDAACKLAAPDAEGDPVFSIARADRSIWMTGPLVALELPENNEPWPSADGSGGAAGSGSGGGAGSAGGVGGVGGVAGRASGPPPTSGGPPPSSSATLSDQGAGSGGSGGNIPNAVADPAPGFGAPGHTATALPDGSVLVAGGYGATQATRVSTEWQESWIWDEPGAPDATVTATTALLPDGRALILTEGRVGLYDGEVYNGSVEPLVNSGSPLAAATQATGKVLLIQAMGTSAKAELVDVTAQTSTPVDLPLSSWGRGLALPFGSLVVAGPNGLDLVRPAETALSGFVVDTVSAKLGCEKPALARLPNGRVLVVGKDELYELDPRTAELSDPVPTKQPRCSATVVIQPQGGALLLGGTDGSSKSSATPELYDSKARSSSSFDLSSSVGEDWPVTYWFDQPTLWAPELNHTPTARADFDWQTGSLRVDPPTAFDTVRAKALRLLPDGSYLAVAALEVAARFRKGPVPDAASFAFPSAPIFHMGSEIDFDVAFPGSAYPGSAPEGSTGTTASSPTNLPVPVWFPTEGCCAATGTVTKSGPKAIFRVPATAFPGEGLLFLSTNGELTGFGPATIAPSENGATCGDAGECESGYCVDGLCCESSCDGVCESCAGAETGDKDGVCAPTPRGKVDARCAIEKVATCGQDGTCDGARGCANYADGTACVEGGECSHGVCKFVERPGGGNAGESASGQAGADAGGGTGGGGAGRAAAACVGDDELATNGQTEPCAPYRCRVDHCAKPCSTSRDCQGGYVCTATGTCEAAHDVTRSTGCGCRLGGSSRQPALGWPALLLVGVGLRRAHGRRSRRMMSGGANVP
jgi:hypothetical protein